MNSSLETFEIGNGFGDIGGDELDLRNLELTDTLIGSCMSELTQALGEPENNVFEQYHLGDGGISDIELTSFVSALIQDAGIRPYSEDPNAAEEEMSELAELMGKRPAPKAKKTEEDAAKKAEEEAKKAAEDAQKAAEEAAAAQQAAAAAAAAAGPVPVWSFDGYRFSAAEVQIFKNNWGGLEGGWEAWAPHHSGAELKTLCRNSGVPESQMCQ